MGSSHDSPVFHESTLGNHFETNADNFEQNGMFLVGDSAYSLRSYLMTPYDNPGVRTNKDNFNFFLSRCRIYVECCFGEIDRRWGIFWKPLVGKLKNHKHTIDACLRLHNFILDHREEEKTRRRAAGAILDEEEESGTTANWVSDKEEVDILNDASDTFLQSHPFHTFS